MPRAPSTPINGGKWVMVLNTGTNINSQSQVPYRPNINTRVAALFQQHPQQQQIRQRVPFPTPMINGYFFKKGGADAGNTVNSAVSLPKPMPMLDVSSPNQSVDLSIDAPFFDIPSPTAPSFNMPSSAPRPISMPAFPSGPDFFEETPPEPYFDDNSSFPFPPDDFGLSNDVNEWSRYGDTSFP